MSRIGQPLAITHMETQNAVEEFRALSLHIISHNVLRDNQLCEIARMTLPIINISQNLFDIMEANSICYKAFQEWAYNTNAHNLTNSHTEEILLHRNDMSTEVVENNLFLDFENLEGSLAAEVSEYSHRFDEYSLPIKNVRDGYIALTKFVAKPDPIFFSSDAEKKDLALCYIDKFEAMHSILSVLVESFQLHFSDPVKFMNSPSAQSTITQHPLALKIHRLQEFLAEQFDIAHSGIIYKSA